jgi:hypothetical protein
MKGSVGTIEDDFDWYAVFGLQGIQYMTNSYGRLAREDAPASRYLSRFNIRMYLEEGMKASLEIQYDNSGEWESKGEIRGTRLKQFMLPVTPKRCDHLRFRMRGQGNMRVYSIGRMLEVGSDG